MSANLMTIDKRIHDFGDGVVASCYKVECSSHQEAFDVQSKIPRSKIVQTKDKFLVVRVTSTERDSRKVATAIAKLAGAV